MPARSGRPDNRPKFPRSKSSPIIAAEPPPLKARTGDAEWAVYLRRKRARLVGRVQAADEEEALRKAYEKFEIPEQERFRISVFELSLPTA